MLLGFFAAVFIAGITAVAATLLGIGTQDTGPPPAWLLIAFFVAAVFLAYVFLLRTAYRLDVADDVLVWRCPLRHGEVPLADLRSVGSLGGASPLAVVRSSTAPVILVFALKGFIEFTGDLVTVAPQVRVQHGLFAR